MKIVAVVVLLLLWVCVLCGPVNYNSFLARLSPKKSYQQYSLLEELDYSVPVRLNLCSTLSKNNMKWNMRLLAPSSYNTSTALRYSQFNSVTTIRDKEGLR
jgi:hypothetical protein